MRPMVLIPVKGLDLAKSRLNLPPDRRRSVARVLMQRTLSTVRASVGVGGFAVVTADEEVKTLTEDLGGTVIHDRHACLNPALDTALTVLRRRDLDRSALVLVADLPLLTRHELDAVIAVVAGSPGPRMVRDLSGAGTTSVSLPAGYATPMNFGPNSAQRFERAGFLPIADAPHGARADLDTTDQLVLLRRGATSNSNLHQVARSHRAERSAMSQTLPSAFVERAHLVDPEADPGVDHWKPPKQTWSASQSIPDEVSTVLGLVSPRLKESSI